MKQPLLGFCLAAVLVGCGGGGGGGTAPATSIPVSQVFSSIFSTQRTFLAKQTTNPNVSLNVTFSPGPDAIFPGSQGLAKTMTLWSTVLQGSTVLSSTGTLVYYKSSPLAVVGYDGRAVTNQYALPSSAPVGASGPFFYIAAANPVYVDNSNNASWIVQSDNNGAWACFNLQEGPGLNTLLGLQSTSIQTLCFLSDTSGNLSAFKASFQDNKQSTFAKTVINSSTFQ